MYKGVKKKPEDIRKSVNNTMLNFIKKNRYILIWIVWIVWFLFYGNNIDTNNVKISNNIFAIKDTDRMFGNPESKITLIEYLDFECEACKWNYPTIKILKEEFKKDINIVVRYFPLDWHKNSNAAAKAAEAAWIQWKFWEMHDVLFENQDTRSRWSSNNQKWFIEYAKQLNLDIEKFEKDMFSDEVKNRIESDKQEWKSIWITWTPSFFLNWQKIQNPKNIDDFRTILKAEILKFPIEKWAKVHEHSDIKIYINNKSIDLSQNKYQSNTWKELSAAQHLHDNNGDNIHKHLTKDSIWWFLSSLKIEFDNNCIKLDTWEKYCNWSWYTLKFFVNNKENSDFDKYEFRDLDRILISYWSEDTETIKKQLDSVKDISCMYSDKCPERWKPPTENCVVWMWWEC